MARKQLSLKFYCKKCGEKLSISSSPPTPKLKQEHWHYDTDSGTQVGYGIPVYPCECTLKDANDLTELRRLLGVKPENK